jgi:hypothetical protein
MLCSWDHLEYLGIIHDLFHHFNFFHLAFNLLYKQYVELDFRASQCPSEVLPHLSQPRLRSRCSSNSIPEIHDHVYLLKISETTIVFPSTALVGT